MSDKEYKKKIEEMGFKCGELSQWVYPVWVGGIGRYWSWETAYRDISKNKEKTQLCKNCNKPIGFKGSFGTNSSGEWWHLDSKKCDIEKSKKCYICGISIVCGMLYITSGKDNEIYCSNCSPFLKSTIENTITSEKDNINHPSHYTQGKIEVSEFIKDQKLGFFDGNVIKYVCRYKYKEKALEDLKKAQWYLNELIKIVEEGIKNSDEA